MIEKTTFLTIVLMASSTYATRVLGFLAIRRFSLGSHMKAVLDSVPGCVLVSVIAPVFVSDRPATLLGLVVTLLTATRLSLLPTVVIGVVSTGVFRHFWGY